MNLKDLIIKNRTYRRFRESERIEPETLHELVGLTRYCASASNRQLLRYLIACTPEETAKVFPTLTWAASLPDWPGPVEGERPAAYIVMLADTRIQKNIFCDDGIAAQSILLGAAEKGLGGCMLAGIERDALRESLSIPAYYDIPLILALGIPAERVVLEDGAKHDPVQRAYWRDEEGVHYVPKRPLEHLIVHFDE